MARLEYQMREASAEDCGSATVVELVGSVDPDTLETFESAMDQLTEANKTSNGQPVLRPDGLYVTYSSAATNLVTGGPSSGTFIYLSSVEWPTTVTAVSPAYGATAGGTTVVIAGIPMYIGPARNWVM